MRRSILTAAVGFTMLAALAAAIGAKKDDKPHAAPPAAQTKPASGEFPDSYYYDKEKRPVALRGMEGKPAPKLTVKDWIGDAQDLSKLKGKVVVVDFWATWCPPCRASLPHNVEMGNKYKEKGLVLIGVHDSARGSEKMPSMAKEKGLNYPLAVDKDGVSTKAYHVSFWPTYVVIDRKGIVRAAGLTPDSVEKVVTKLLDEKAD